MSLTAKAVTSADAVGPVLSRVAVSTRDRDRLPLLLSDSDGKGWAEGCPDLSRDVCTVWMGNPRQLVTHLVYQKDPGLLTPLVALGAGPCTVCTSEVVRDVNILLGMVVVNDGVALPTGAP